MRHLQLKRSDIIYDNEKQALEAVKKQAKATYGDTTSTTARVMRDGEPILASYRDDNAPNKVADILALLIKKDDGTDALFYIDSQNILNKIGITVDGDINDLWLKLPADDDGKTPIVVEDGKTTTVIDAIRDLATYIVEAGKNNGKIEELSAKTITGLEDTDTIDFNVTPAEDGTLKADGSVKVSSDVEDNLLKVSGSTGLYVSTNDIKGVAGAVDEITKTTDQTKFANSANTFTIRYATKDKQDAIQQITYDSAMDSGLTTPSNIGGIAAGTKAQDLNGNSISKILDMILFPEIFPTLSPFGVDITGGGSYEVGTNFPSFTVKANRGLVTCPGQADKYVLGEVTKTATYTGATHTTEAETLPSTVGYGTIYVHGYAEFAQGDELKTSYGHTATKDVNGKPISQNPHPTTALTGGNSAVTGFYKYGGNMTTINAIEKAAGATASNKGNNVVKNGATIYNSALIVDYKSKEASKAGGLVDGNGGYVLALPSIMNITIKDVLQFNSGSGSWDASVKDDWEVFTPTTEDSTKFPGTLTDAAGRTYPVTYFKHKADSTALDGTGAARVSFAFVW